MLIIYVGDSKNVISRIHDNHCNGNVEGSALRKHVANAKGYTFTRTRRESGSIRVRLDLADPQMGEKDISDYICSGFWKLLFCPSYNEAHDFQWYLIDKLDPVLNETRKPWDEQNDGQYAKLLTALTASPSYACNRLKGQQKEPGVYVFYHNTTPQT
jgi:hypothetical protein